MAGLEQRLVAVGVDLLEREGPGRLGLREIARQAGVSHGAPRRYFPTHQQLLGAIAKSGASDLTRGLEQALMRGGVLGAAREYVTFARSRPEMFRLIFRHDLLADSGHSLREVWLPLLGRVSEVAGEEDALLIWTHVHGIATFAADRTLEPAGQAGRIDDLVTRAVTDRLGQASSSS
ncbi:TetR/AcrR family transcriptional regulator [Kineosporia succinea]|uniref:AcrR family transcriptional regulator n=1 Tax=Kineosporia succinea TaxID=84632 RepID=A0ABT9NYL2_9ACTN|nr:TetR/AcrR family transcriptional regulator [Kineosporia succinea]MDP9825532.1 AcrR family transcriptional regulator [Kineosporia succinea]